MGCYYYWEYHYINDSIGNLQLKYSTITIDSPIFYFFAIDFGSA